MSEFGQAAKPSKKISGRGIIGIIIAVIAVIFMIQNTDDAQISLLMFDVTLPLWIVILVVFLLGMFLGGAVRAGVRKLRGTEAPEKK